MTKYYYIVKNNDNTHQNDLYHFDFKLPDVGKFIADVGKNITNIADSAGKNISKNLDDISKNTSNAIKGTLGGMFGREWKNHKWVARKRDKNGKWIYDYGKGFPGESNLGGVTPVNYTPDNDIKLYGPSAIEKVLTPIAGLGKALFGLPSDVINGGKEFIGGFQEIAKQMKANDLKNGTQKDSTGFSRKKSDQGKDFDLHAANPGWDNKDGGSQYNCPCASAAYDLRRRGYEVTAKQTRKGLPRAKIASLYKNPQFKEVTPDEQVYISPNMTVSDYTKTAGKKLANAVDKAFDKEPDNTRGMAIVNWAGGGGHIFCYEKENGKTKIFDAQSGEKLDMSDYASKSVSFEYFRTDNLEPNYDQMKKVVE